MKMKALLSLAMCLLICSCGWAQSSNSTINFNLVQVNQYAGQDQATADLQTPGPRVVVDPNSPNAVSILRQMNSQKTGPGVVTRGPLLSIDIKYRSSDFADIPWESSRVFVATSGQDSFLVRSSMTGCPGTEVRPSVSVAFPSGGGWSFPPIRFGPLTESTICALGHDQQLEVSVVGNQAPRVRLLSMR